ncbi:MAG: type II toxin-antitoxin system VapC family toxin [Candidatus Jordarchaeales archaeon]
MEDGKVCLDSDVLISYLRGKSAAVDDVRRLEEEAVTLSTTSINAFEVFYGAYKSGRRMNVESASRLMERLVILHFDREAAEAAGRILAQLEAKGELVEFRDVLIGATCLVNGYTIATWNAKHFRRIPGLKIIELQR